MEKIFFIVLFLVVGSGRLFDSLKVKKIGSSWWMYIFGILGKKYLEICIIVWLYLKNINIL